MANIVDGLFNHANTRGLIRAGAPIMITLPALQDLHAHWARLKIPPVMTFCGCPLRVVELARR